MTKKTKGKQRVRHGAYSYMTKLTVPDNRAYLRPYLTAVREGLIHDLGPAEEDLTTAQKLIIDRVVGQAGVIRLIEEYCREEGIFRGPRLQPVLAKNYGSFTNSLRLNLQALGLDKRLPAVPDVMTYIAAFDAEKAAQASQDQGKDKPKDQGSPLKDGEKGDPGSTSSEIQGKGKE